MKSLPIWMAILIIVLSIPMAMRRVPINSFYGFRTPKTMSSTQIWYEANQRAGVNLILAGVSTLVVWAVLRMLSGAGKANFIGFPVFLGLLLVSVVVSFVQLRKM